MDIKLVAISEEKKPVPVIHRSSMDKSVPSKLHDCPMAGKVSPCGPHHCGHCHSGPAN